MILITGVTGKNGSEIARRLGAQGVALRGMVRRKSDSLPSIANLEYVEADFNDAASLRKALHSIDSAFLVTNSSEHVEAQQLRFVEAAREAGVKRVVYLSQLHAAADSPLRFLRYHAAVEAALQKSGMEFVNLRPNLYMQGLLMIGKTIATDHKFFAPAGDARISVVDVRDIAAVAAVALTEAGHAGKTYDLTGPKSLTHTEMAEQLSSALGFPVTFVDLPEKDFREALRKFQMPDWQADGLIEDFAHYRRGEAAGISPAIEQITGSLPKTFAEFATDFREEFLRPAC
jgi:uncharacterized protein YbjT (DUF2867 family)